MSQARAAAMNGDHARVGRSCSRRSPTAQPDQADLAQQGARARRSAPGRWTWRCSLARTIPAAKLPTDARLLLVADEVKRRRLDRALPWLDARRRQRRPVVPRRRCSPPGTRPSAAIRPGRWRRVDQIPVNSLLGPLARRGAGADPAQVPPDRRRRAVRAARDRLARARARPGCGWPSPTASSPPATARGRGSMVDGMGVGDAAARAADPRRQAERPGDRHVGRRR